MNLTQYTVDDLNALPVGTAFCVGSLPPVWDITKASDGRWLFSDGTGYTAEEFVVQIKTASTVLARGWRIRETNA